MIKSRKRNYRATNKLNKCLLVMIMALGHTGASAQFYEWHWDNTDLETRQKLGVLIETITERNTKLEAVNRRLADALDDHRKQLHKNFDKNRYDDGFLLQSGLSIGESLAVQVLGDGVTLPYMPHFKKEYHKRGSDGKIALLGALNLMDASKISAGKRQEIYRLRNALLREFSKHDRETRKSLLFSVAALSFLEAGSVQVLMQMLNNVEEF